MVEEFYLYILMRNDMDSLNPGKAVAQGAHAANQFVKQRYQLWNKEYKKWAGDRGYGTTIVLSASQQQIIECIMANPGDDYCKGIVTDETYPLKDGDTTHYFPCMTCGYIFAPRGYHGVKHLKLMK